MPRNLVIAEKREIWQILIIKVKVFERKVIIVISS
jgi:hypothetical protein